MTRPEGMARQRESGDFRDRFLKGTEWAFLGMLLLANGVLVTHLALKHPHAPWLEILGERNTMTWFSSMQIAGAGFLALAVAILRCLRQGCSRLGSAPWLVLGAGFLMLAADEAVSWHETFQGTIPGLPAHEGVLLVVGIVGGGAACLCVWRDLRVAAAQGWFVAAVVIAAVAQGVDIFGSTALDLPYASAKLIEMGEEVMENLAQVAFLVALLRVAFGQLRGILAPDALAEPAARSRPKAVLFLRRQQSKRDSVSPSP